MAKYTIDPSHSQASFTVRHMMISNVRGEFQKLSGTVEFDPANVGATKISADLEVASLSTGDEKRDAHLRSADFFDAEKHATITFRSTSAEAKGAGEIEVRGDLTIHGVTKEVVLAVEGPTAPAKDPWGNERIGASAATKIKRTDFGLVWNVALEAGGILVGEDVKIALDVSLIRG